MQIIQVTNYVTSLWAYAMYSSNLGYKLIGCKHHLP